MTRKSFLSRLDESVRWSGLPALAEGKQRRRPLRFTSTLALALAAVGFAVGVGQPERHMAGMVALMLGFAIGTYMPVFGPLKPWGGIELVDERERGVRARAYLGALGVLAAVSVLGLWLLSGLSSTLGWSFETLRRSLTDFAFLLGVIYLAGPTCLASWAERPVGEDGP